MHFAIVIQCLLIHLFSFINEVSFFLLEKGYCVYVINKITHAWSFSLSFQLNISLIHCPHLWAIELNTQREIP